MDTNRQRSRDEEEQRCAEARKHEQIDAAFRRGDLDALRAAVDDGSAIPNGRMPATIGTCLVYAIYHSPLPFIRTLLEIGADPNLPVDDGFPPLIAALSCTTAACGTARRLDVPDILRVLLSSGADPNQRGINDYTALHMAVAQRDAAAAQMLLDAGADPELRTRIDACETPLEMARTAGFADVEAILARKGQTLPRRLRAGLTLLLDIPGAREPVRRQQQYRIRLRLSLKAGEAVRWQTGSVPTGASALADDGRTLITTIRLDRGSLIGGLYYGLQDMRVGGTRRLQIAPHLGYADRGVPGIIPPRAILIAEATVIEPSGPV
jgi:uncharacterized protein